MTNKAYFFRDVKNIEELKYKTSIAISQNKLMQSFEIIEVIELEEEEFNDLINCFHKTKDFVKRYSYRLTMNLKTEYICILVICKKFDFEILVNSSGYSYPRIVALKNV